MRRKLALIGSVALGFVAGSGTGLAAVAVFGQSIPLDVLAGLTAAVGSIAGYLVGDGTLPRDGSDDIA